MSPFGLFFPIALLAGLVEVREIGPVELIICGHRWRDDLLVDLIPDIRFALQLSQVPKAAAFGDGDRNEGLAGVQRVATHCRSMTAKQVKS